MLPDDPLSEAELDELDQFLSAEDMPEESMDPAMLDGFLTAIAIGPTTLLPSRWLPVVFGETPEQRVPWTSVKQMERINTLIFRHLNGIIEMLDQYPDDYYPLVYESEDEPPVPIIDEWCTGFVRAMELDPSGWQALQESEDSQALLMPILLYGTEEGWQQIEADAALEARHLEFADMLGDCVLGIRDFWLPARKRASTIRHDVPPTGRNDACPCGSGKKFKKCCGAPERLH